MNEVWIAGAFALFVWWFGTGAVLFADRLPRSAHRTAMALATILALGALGAIAMTAGELTLASALIAFTASVVVWGWHELSFLVGLVTGPRKTACPPGARGLRRFMLASATLIHHEIAIALTGAALWLWLADAANPVALWTFGVLWAMRLSAKLNLFLGAPNVAEEFLPDTLSYLTTYFSKRPINGLFPVSVTVGTLATAALAVVAAQKGGAEGAALALVATMTGLGTLEHWFLVLPFKEAALWRWWMETRARRAESRALKSARRAQRLPAGSTPAMLERG